MVNLASKEYGRAVEPRLSGAARFVTCVFAEERSGTLTEKGTLCKMARGRMVRWMAERRAARPEELRDFAELGYRFSPERLGERPDGLCQGRPVRVPRGGGERVLSDSRRGMIRLSKKFPWRCSLCRNRPTRS